MPRAAILCDGIEQEREENGAKTNEADSLTGQV